MHTKILNESELKFIVSRLKKVIYAFGFSDIKKIVVLLRSRP